MAGINDKKHALAHVDHRADRDDVELERIAFHKNALRPIRLRRGKKEQLLRHFGVGGPFHDGVDATPWILAAFREVDMHEAESGRLLKDKLGGRRSSR